MLSKSTNHFSNGVSVGRFHFSFSFTTSFSQSALGLVRRSLQIMVANIKISKTFWKHRIFWQRPVDYKFDFSRASSQSIAYINVKLISHFPNQVANFGIKISSIVDNINNGMSNLKIVKVQIF